MNGHVSRYLRFVSRELKLPVKQLKQSWNNTPTKERHKLACDWNLQILEKGETNEST